MMDELGTGGMDPNVVGGPPATKLVGAGGQLTNQVGKSPVVRAPAGLRVQQGDSVVGDLELWYDSFPLALDLSQSLLTYTAEPGSPSQEALSLLASWAATAGVGPVGSTDDLGSG